MSLRIQDRIPRRLAVLVLGGVVLAACGGGSGNGTKVASVSGTAKSAASRRSTGTSTESFREQLLAYAQCMRTNGVDFADPQFDANGRPQFNRQGGGAFDQLRNSPSFDKAQTACASKRPDFAGQFQRTPAEQAQMRENLLKFAKCMRSKGIDFPDPTFDANGRPQFDGNGGPGGAQGQNRDDPNAEAAREACQKEVGGTFGRGPGGPGGPGGPPPSSNSSNGSST